MAGAATEIILRDYQERGVSDVRLAFRKFAAVLYVLATGGGKTFLFCYITRQATKKGRRVLIIVHRKELLLQASRSLTDLGIPHGMISPHFTPNPAERVQIASVDTLLIRLKKRRYKFDLVVFDEAHHVTDSNKWGQVYEALGRPPMLGVTATPSRTDGIGLGVHAGGVFEAMVEGPSYSELIAQGHLMRPRIYGTLEVPDTTGVRRNRDGDWNARQLAERTDRPEITGDAVEHYRTICPGAKAIVFCVNIKHAQHVVEEFNAAGFRFALLVGAPTMSDAQRTEVNRGLASGKYQGAVTVDLVSEGYDLPDLECCIMLRKSESLVLFLQQVGRIMRPAPGKTRCILLDHVGNVGATIDGEFVVKHGLPDQDREWSLDGREKRSRGENDEDDLAIRQCDRCYAVHPAAPVCPVCGYEYPVRARKIEQGDGQLQEITEDMAAELRRAALREQGQAQDLAALMQLGHSRARAEKILEARREKNLLRAELTHLAREWTNATGRLPARDFGFTMNNIRYSMKPKALREAIQQVRDALEEMEGDNSQAGRQLEAAL